MCTGAFWGRPLAEAVQRCSGSEGLRAAEDGPCPCGFPCPFLCARTLTCSSTVLLAHVYADLSLALFFHMHFVHLLFGPPYCYCNLSLSFSLCSLGCFAASYFAMSLFIPFDNNNIRTYIEGPKVPASCR